MSPRQPPPSPKRIMPVEVAKALRLRGYLARQTKDVDPLWRNLGGPRSEINRPDSRGAILLKPDSQQAFGVCCSEVRAFRNQVMALIGGNTLERRTGVPGPSDELGRVEANYVDCSDAGRGVVCEDSRGQIRLPGYGDLLRCYKDGYEWADIEKFLKLFEAFCSRSKTETS